MKVSSSKDVTIEDALSIVMEYMNKEEKKYLDSYKGGGRFEVKYFDDESSSINLNIEESRERMDRFMPTRMSLLKESLISDTQKRNHNYGKISFIKINIIYFVLSCW